MVSTLFYAQVSFATQHEIVPCKASTDKRGDMAVAHSKPISRPKGRSDQRLIANTRQHWAPSNQGTPALQDPAACGAGFQLCVMQPEPCLSREFSRKLVARSCRVACDAGLSAQYLHSVARPEAVIHAGDAAIRLRIVCTLTTSFFVKSKKCASSSRWAISPSSVM